MKIVIILIAIAALIWAIPFLLFRTRDLSRFDSPAGEAFSTGEQPNDQHRAVNELLGAPKAQQGLSKKEQLLAGREYMDHMWDDREFTSTFTAVDVGGIPAEWVQAPGVDSRRRVLYLHGGAFMMGSPKSHRPVTAKFSEMANAAVLAIDYRLMPEHPRMASVEDSRAAYRWILENGPDGPEPLTALVVAGDSAGGSLTLSVIAWARDEGLRPADAAVGLSPATDSSLVAPSWAENLETDIMLKEAVRPMLKIPGWLSFWGSWASYRINPLDPAVSPVRGDLSGLPPILIQISDVEMLRDDGRRYANKAAAAGTTVKLQRWNHVPHVWQMFDAQLDESRQAFEQIDLFLQQHLPPAAPRPSRAPVAPETAI